MRKKAEGEAAIESGLLYVRRRQWVLPLVFHEGEGETCGIQIHCIFNLPRGP
jgi:hypothetical protein